jgi:hypothetical protein
MNAVVAVEVGLRPGQALLGDRPAFEGAPPCPGRLATHGRYYATMGVPLKAPGEELPQYRGIFPDGSLSYIDVNAVATLTNLSEDVTLAARDALQRMIDYLVATKGLTPDQAYPREVSRRPAHRQRRRRAQRHGVHGAAAKRLHAMTGCGSREADIRTYWPSASARTGPAGLLTREPMEDG